MRKFDTVSNLNDVGLIRQKAYIVVQYMYV